MGGPLTAPGLLDGELGTLPVEAHVEQSIEIGRHLGGECRVWLQVQRVDGELTLMVGLGR